MNRDSYEDDAKGVEEVFDFLLVAYDDALASGTLLPVVDSTGIPTERLPELADVQACLDLLERARRFRQTPASDAPAGPHGLSASDALALDSPQPDHRIDRFRIVRELGRGGHGVVFLAWDEALRRHVALKVPRAEVSMTPELTHRFLREAQAAGSLAHPNLVAVYDVGEDGPFRFIATAYCSGPTLAEWLRGRREPVPFQEAALLVAALADGVDCAHGLGVLHRDIKPSNVLLEPQAEGTTHCGTRFTPKLTDFGLARLQDGDGLTTCSGTLLGTASYMAPEQATGQLDQIGRSTDVYGLGTILYELLTSQRAFQGAGDVDTVRRVVEDAPLRPRRLRSDIPRDLEAICLKCLEKRSVRRYPSAADLAADLRRFLGGASTLARPMTLIQRLAAWMRRRPALAGLIAVSLVALILVVGINVAYTRYLQDSRDTAEMHRARATASQAIAEQQAYAATMRTAQWAWQTSNRQVFLQLLTSYGQSELRGFEWHYLEHLSQRGQTRLHPQQPGEVDGVAIAPDGKSVATANRNGTIDIWSYPDGERLRSFRAHDICANLVRYSPDGRLLATASCDATIRLWDPASLELVREIRSPGGPIRTFRFGPQGEKIYSSGDESLLRVWNVATGESLGTFQAAPGTPGEDGLLKCLALSEDGSLLAGAGYGSSVIVWETKSRTMLNWIGKSLRTPAIQFVGDQSLLAIAEPYRVRIVSIPEGQPQKELRTHGLTYCLAMRKDTETLYCATDVGVVDVCDLARGVVTSSISLHTQRITDFAVLPDGRHLITSSLDSSAVILDLEQADPAEPFERVPLPDGNLRAAVLNAQAAKLAMAVNDDEHNSVFVRDVGGDRAGIQLPRQTSWPVDRLDFSFDGHYLSLRNDSDDDLDEIWRINEEDPVLVQIGQRLQSIAGAEPRDYYQIRKSDTNGLRVIDARNETVVSEWSMPETPHFLDIRPGSRWLFCGVGNAVFTWDGHAQQLLRPITVPARVHAVDLSREGNLLAVGHDTGADLFDFPSGEALHSLHGHIGRVNTVAFSPDSRTLATAGDGQIIRLWNVGSGQEMLTLEGHTGPISGLSFARDGKTLISIAHTPSGHAPVEVFCWRAD